MSVCVCVQELLGRFVICFCPSVWVYYSMLHSSDTSHCRTLRGGILRFFTECYFNVFFQKRREKKKSE